QKGQTGQKPLFVVVRCSPQVLVGLQHFVAHIQGLGKGQGGFAVGGEVEKVAIGRTLVRGCRQGCGAVLGHQVQADGGGFRHSQVAVDKGWHGAQGVDGQIARLFAGGHGHLLQLVGQPQLLQGPQHPEGAGFKSVVQGDHGGLNSRQWQSVSRGLWLVVRRAYCRASSCALASALGTWLRSTRISASWRTSALASSLAAIATSLSLAAGATLCCMSRRARAMVRTASELSMSPAIPLSCSFSSAEGKWFSPAMTPARTLTAAASSARAGVVTAPRGRAARI